MKIKSRYKLFCACVCIVSTVGTQNLYAQEPPSLEIKGLLRQGMKECREAKTLRRTDLAGALERFQVYRGLVEQVLVLDPNLFDSKDSTVHRVLNFCNAVKQDLDRAEALPLFERALVECREARVSLSNGAFDEAKDKQGQYIQFRESAVALTESVMDVYESSYELKLCEQLEQDIAVAEKDYLRQVTSLAENQRQFNEVIASYGEALSQCRGAQSIINDKTRYTAQTTAQVGRLLIDARKSKTDTDAKYAAMIAAKNRPDAAGTNRINRLIRDFTDCDAAVPNGIARISQVLKAAARKLATTPISTGGTKTTPPPPKTLVNSNYSQIVGAQAKYPVRALRRNIEGHVSVRFMVSKAGNAENIEILESVPKGVFDKAVINAVNKYKFQPAIKQGVPVNTSGVERKIVFKFSS